MQEKEKPAAWKEKSKMQESYLDKEIETVYSYSSKKPLSMIILAGGSSSRMGTDKADMLYYGKTFLEIQIEKGKQLGIRDILVSGYRGSRCGERVVMDRISGKGPLGGLEACLRQAANERCLVLSVDVPLVTAEEIEGLIEYSRRNPKAVTILQHEEKQEPLIGVYNVGLADAMAQTLEQGGGSVFAFLRRQGYGVYFSRGEETQFSNINDMADYRRMTEEKKKGKTGKVLRIKINPRKGGTPVHVDRCPVVQGSGMEGDWHTGQEDRAVCLCRKEILDWMDLQEVRGICFDKRKENFLLEGFDDGQLLPGVRLEGSEAVLEISGISKFCFGEECPLVREKIPCRLREEYQMARIVRTGTIRTGEELKLTQKDSA